MKKKVDITGLMVKARPGWETRAEKLAKPKFFLIDIGLDPELVEGLSKKEHKRLVKKLLLVCEAATYMAAGMVKGTVKYPIDDPPVSTFMAHVVGEGADQMNYQILLADAFARKGKK